MTDYNVNVDNFQEIDSTLVSILDAVESITPLDLFAAASMSAFIAAGFTTLEVAQRSYEQAEAMMVYRDTLRINAAQSKSS